MATPLAPLPRGFRNNNPLNIRRTSDKWLGLSEHQTDPDFFQFSLIEYGIRAALVIIRNYQRRQHAPITVEDVINKWAPPQENNTTAYIDFVRTYCSCKSDTPVSYSSRDFTLWLVAGMIYYENGRFCETYDLKRAWGIYLRNV